MRALGADVGERRIGLAVADTETGIAVPAGVIEQTGLVAGCLALAGEAEVREVDLIVVGMPLSMTGRSGPQARVIEDFVTRLREATSIPVETWDERLSTAEAERRTREMGGEPGRRRGRPQDKGEADAGAAAVVLQAYLDSRRSRERS